MKNRNQKNAHPAPVAGPAAASGTGRSRAPAWKTAIFVAASLVVLVAGFAGNALQGVLPRHYQFDVYDIAGEQTIADTMKISAQWGLMVNCGLGYQSTIDTYMADALRSDGKANLHREYVYTSQPLFHRVVYSALYRVMGGDFDRFYQGLKTTMAVLLAVVMTLFAWRIGREFGWVAAAVVVLMVLLSDWVAFVARNPYDVYYLKFVPFLATWLLYPRVLEGRMRLGTLLWIVGVCVFLNAASVFEFISNVMMGAAVGVVYFGIARGAAWKTVGKHALAVTLAGVAAFLVVLALHFARVCVYEGSLSQGWERLSQKIAARTYGHGTTFEGGAADHDSAPPGVSAAMILHSYSTLKAASIPFEPAEPKIYLTFFSFFLLGLAFLPFAFIDTSRFPALAPYRQRLPGLAAALVVAFAGTLTWPLLAKGHMYHHMHQNAIAFYLSFMLVLYAAMGAVFALLGAEIKRRVVSRWFP